LANQITIRTPSVPDVNLTTLTRTFNISAEYCTPATPGPKASTLQILSHGLGFNRSYWDFYLPSKPKDAQHSYINSATGAGYSTLSYNRLGIEPSTIADPYREIQGFVEVAVLAGLTTLVRAGNITEVPVPQKVIHVGHSWGSEISVGLAAVAPGLSDGIVLTGYSGISTYTSFFIANTAFHFANQNQPKRFPPSKYSSGFLTWPDKFGNQFSFLEYPYFDTAVLDRAEATKYPFTVGEFLTASTLPVAAPNFQGPVLYVAAQSDLIFCASNCTGLFGPESIAVEGFNGSSSVETYIQPNVGHGINLHHNATGAYNVILDWADRHGF
jgi:pimeloyl-ACP methyl ester carboxylesterase